MITRGHIINHMLSTVGESGVSYTDTQHPSVLTAKRILETEDLDFQSPGWWFNKEYELRLVPDANGFVNVPQTALDIKLSNVEQFDPNTKRRYVRRGNRLYDASEHTYKVKQPILVDLIVHLDVDDMPTVASSFLMHQAALTMYVSDDGDQFKTNKLEQRVSLAWQKLRAAEMKNLGVNASDNQVSRRLALGGYGSFRSPRWPGGRIG